MRTGLAHGLVGVGGGEDPRRSTDRAPGEPPGVTGPVEPLPALPGGTPERGEGFGLVEHPLRELRLEPDPLPFAGGERPRLVPHGVWRRPAARRCATATKVEDYGGLIDRSSDVEGHTVNFVSLREAQDITPVLASLPGGACTCPHWGYVIAGRITVAYDDGRQETIEAGDAFYLPAGHTSWAADAGTEFVQFSPADHLAEVAAAIARSLQGAPSGGERGRHPAPRS